MPYNILLPNHKFLNLNSLLLVLFSELLVTFFHIFMICVSGIVRETRWFNVDSFIFSFKDVRDTIHSHFNITGLIQKKGVTAVLALKY